MSILLTIHMYQLGAHRNTSRRMLYWGLLLKSVVEIQVCLKPDKLSGTLYEGLSKLYMLTAPYITQQYKIEHVLCVHGNSFNIRVTCRCEISFKQNYITGTCVKKSKDPKIPQCTSKAHCLSCLLTTLDLPHGYISWQCLEVHNTSSDWTVWIIFGFVWNINFADRGSCECISVTGQVPDRANMLPRVVHSTVFFVLLPLSLGKCILQSK
jgi:hypothetical protein